VSRVTATISITMRDSSVIEVNRAPVWNEHPEHGISEAVAVQMTELVKSVDKRRCANRRIGEEH
jgi:hypothetical protein